ncbi:MAG TPA: hypothetical protein VF523_13090 [Burkholderiales bacterium]
MMDEPTVIVFSVQRALNFPCYTETSALDIELPDATGDMAYLDAPERGVRRALPAAQRELEILQASKDPCQDDRPGRLAMSRQGPCSRDRTVPEHCHAAGVPVAIVMAGGYSFLCGANGRAISSCRLATGRPPHRMTALTPCAPPARFISSQRTQNCDRAF